MQLRIGSICTQCCALVNRWAGYVYYFIFWPYLKFEREREREREISVGNEGVKRLTSKACLAPIFCFDFLYIFLADLYQVYVHFMHTETERHFLPYVVSYLRVRTYRIRIPTYLLVRSSTTVRSKL